MFAIWRQSSEYCSARYRDELTAHPNSSLVHFRLAGCLLKVKDRAAAANEFPKSLDGDREAQWITVCTERAFALPYGIEDLASVNVTPYRCVYHNFQESDRSG
jgi:hypothetical protein